MPVILKADDHGAALGVWQITEPDDELLRQLQLNAAELRHIETLKHSKRFAHWLSSRVLLRQMLNTDKFIELGSDAKRKPVLGNFPHHVSFSHSHQMAAVLISEAHEVGIDIERLDAKVIRVQHKFLSGPELGAINRNNEVEDLVTCWCAKEALFKLYGHGGVDFINDLHLDLPRTSSDAIRATITKEGRTEHQVHLKRLDDYVLAYVVG